MNLKDMENSAVAGRVIPLPSYSETLAKNPLNDFLKLDADRTQKDSRSIYFASRKMAALLECMSWS